MRIIVTIFLITFLSSCSSHEPADQAQDNIEFTKRFFTEVYNQDKIDLIDELFVEDYNHITTAGDTFTGTDKVKSLVKSIKSIFPNLKLEITEAVADNEKAMFLISITSDLPKMANPESKAKKISFTETYIFWVKDGYIYKGRTSGAHLPMIKQLSGFEGTMQEIIMILSKEKGSGETEL
ncbi:ester cyclase [Winogradskyella aurantia]|uniref:SnoaL-like domain-containing protein n=1 Tax=Winogradskyella aurantia TaxID=1915063 RepID=A0A265UYE5_9FLAO|nr:ester cyclase [Winogradskyella aurantia]OZV70087.1 hypothetical protein CA834_05570 [Winogradskyella aurantia]